MAKRQDVEVKSVGAPVTTGRGRSLGKAVLVRLSQKEHAELSIAADTDDADSLATWIRETALSAARSR